MTAPTTHASGIGSWPGTRVREAVITVRDLLVDGDGLGLPYLPETPARGPGAELIGRAAGLLVDLPVDLQPAGWRFVDRPGRDAQRTAALHREDLDELAEAYDGYAGSLKIQVAGPWTLAASVELTRGERSVSDAAAVADIAASLGEGIGRYAADIRRLVPGAQLVVQLDEPSLPAVLAGRLPTASGYGRLRAVDPQIAGSVLGRLVGGLAHPVVVHCCDPAAPVALLRSTGAAALALDLIDATPGRWESVAVTIESGVGVYAGCLPTTGSAGVEAAHRLVLDAADRLGLSGPALGQMTITPACGLAGASVGAARHTQRTALDVARELTEDARR